jgi:hypothetical protein
LNKGYIPRISAKSDNNGIIGHFDTENLEVARHFENFITVNFFGTDGGIFYHPYKASVEMKVHTLKIPKINLDNYSGNFIASALKPTLKGFNYGSQLSSSKLKSLNFKINLPQKDNQINFDFIDKFMANVENECLTKIKEYLVKNNLNDTALTSDEKNALDSLNSIDFKSFKVIDIFDIKNAGNILSKSIVENSGKIPYLCAGSSNNSVSTYISYDSNYLDMGNCIFIGGKTFVVTYQKENFFSNDSHNLTLRLKTDEQKNKLCQLFLATCIKSSLGNKYSWGDSISSTKIKKDSIFLPAKNTQPDYDFMKNFLSAIDKLTVKKLIVYLERKSGSDS